MLEPINSVIDDDGLLVGVSVNPRTGSIEALDRLCSPCSLSEPVQRICRTGTIFLEAKEPSSKPPGFPKLRILVHIADDAVGVAGDLDDEIVAIPLGLVALYWIRMFKPLIEAGVPQMPITPGGQVWAL